VFKDLQLIPLPRPARCADAMAWLTRSGGAALFAVPLAVLLVACGGGGQSETAVGTAAVGNAASTAVAKVSLEAAGAHCAYGGSRIETGFDADHSGTLEIAEVSAVQYACHGAPGTNGTNGTDGTNGTNGAPGNVGTTSLVRIENESAGANCAHGGSKISVGLDLDGSGVLDPAEIASTSYVCSGADGVDGTNGTNGTDGTDGTDGTNGTSGTNGTNGTNGSNGLSSLIAIVDESAGAHCAVGGKKVTTGLDSNANQVLDAGEVTNTDYVCNGVAGSGGGMTWVNVTATSQTMATNTGYVASSASQVTLTLPASLNIGDTVAVTGGGLGGWKIAQNAGQFITARNLSNDLPAGAAWSASGSNQSWTAAAASADGLKLVAVGWGSQIYTSVDAGATWTARESSRQWMGVASSADGSKLVAVDWTGQIYTSSDSGANWAARDSARNWLAVASSGDGSKLVALVSGGQIYTSTDSGANWTASDTNRAWISVASSGDGSKLVASTSGGQLYTSTDSGANWTARDSGRNWRAVASSSDGNKLVAVVDSGQVYTSVDAGVNWTARESARSWRAVASSANGSRLIAAVGGGQMYVSTDSGVNWTARESARVWYAVTSSADGTRLAAFDGNTGLAYTSAGDRSTLGTAGSVSGSQYDALTLQYIGGGEFVTLQAALTGPLHVE
jgi:hypothetical protein